MNFEAGTTRSGQRRQRRPQRRDGPHTIDAGAGNDYITADDHEPDTIDGCADDDTAFYDASYDTVVNVEKPVPAVPS